METVVNLIYYSGLQVGMNLTGYILIAYLITIAAVGIWYGKKSRSTSGFFVAGRELSWAVLAATIAASTIGGSATIVTAKLAYSIGMPALNMDLFAGLGLIALGVLMAAKVREMNVYSLPEMGEKLFGRTFRLLSSVLVLFSEVAWVALLTLSTMFVLSVALDIDTTTALITASVIFIIYTLVGGQYGVSITDVIQLAIMVIGILFIAIPFALMTPGHIPPSKLTYPTGNGMNGVQVAALFFLMFLPHFVGPDIYSKILSARSQGDAMKGTILAGVIKVVFGLGIVFLGLKAAAILPDIDAGMALPSIISHLLPPALAAVVFAALVATMMSSADTCLLTGATVTAHDIVKPLFRVNEKTELLISRISVVGLGILSLYIALLLNDIIKILVLAYTVFASGIILPILAGMYAKYTGITPKGAVSGLVIGGISSLVWMFGVESQFDPILVGMGLCIAVMFSVSAVENYPGRR